MKIHDMAWDMGRGFFDAARVSTTSDTLMAGKFESEAKAVKEMKVREGMELAVCLGALSRQLR